MYNYQLNSDYYLFIRLHQDATLQNTDAISNYIDELLKADSDIKEVAVTPIGTAEIEVYYYCINDYSESHTKNLPNKLFNELKRVYHDTVCYIRVNTTRSTIEWID